MRIEGVQILQPVDVGPGQWGRSFLPHLWCEIMHVIGNANIVPDALSRLHDPVCSILRKSANGIGVVRPFAPKVLRQRTYYSIHRLSNTGFEAREKS